MGVLPSGPNPDEGTGATLPKMEGPIDRTGFFSNVSAGYQAAKAGPGSTRSRQNAAEAGYYDQIIKALTAEGEMGEDLIDVRPGGFGYRGPKNIPVNRFGVGKAPVKRPFRNPYTDAPALSQGDNPLERFYLGGDQTERLAIWEAIQRVRSRKPGFLKDLPDESALAKRAQADRNKRLAGAQAVTARAGTLGTVGAFIGNVAGSIAAGDPENFIGLGVGGAAGKTVARTVIKRAVAEGAVNAVAGVTALPGQVVDTERLGGEMTTGDMVRSVGEQAAIGAVFGTAVAAAPHVAAKVGEAVSNVAGATIDTAAKLAPVRDALAAASLRAGTVKDRADLREFRRVHSPYSVGDTATPDEKAAVHVIERDAEVAETSPLHPEAVPAHNHRLDAVAAAMGVDVAPSVPSPAPIQHATVSDHSASAQAPRRPASFVEAVHHAEGTGKNPRSSAQGHGQFIDSTWLVIAPRVADTSKMSRGQILALRQDRDIAERATNLYAADNGRHLRSHGLEDSPGNLSLAHFLGPQGAEKVLKANPATPIESLLPAGVIHANREVLAGKSASQVVAWAHKRIGAAIDGPVARADAVPDADPLDPADFSELPYERMVFKPDDLQTDAALMQYKEGGDEFGVTGKLKDVTAWNPIHSSEVLVWEGNDGRRIVVDGHQRTGLAKRLYADDPSIELPAIVLREADGVTAAQARTIGALRNINLGTGTLLDNARVLRDAPNGADEIRGAPERRSIEGLARLNYEAFGAVANDVIDPRIAAEIGNNAPPESHMAMVDLLTKERIRNPAEAANIVRQAVADGFGTAEEHQLGMFGDAPQQSLYVPIARILDASAKRLREEKRTFKVLAEKAGRIEEAGNVLDRTANKGRIVGADEAIGILNATAHRAGPVRDALIAAARAELSGTRRADAVGEFLDALAGIDLRIAAAGVEPGRVPGKPPGEARGGDAAEASDGELAGSDGPSLFDTAVSARAQAEPFSDPVGQAAKDQTAILEHDLRPDPNIAARQAQETTLRAETPLRSGEDQEGTMGLSLFDVADEPTFRLSDEGEARPLGELMSEAEADEIAAQAIWDCLK